MKFRKGKFFITITLAALILGGFGFFGRYLSPVNDAVSGYFNGYISLKEENENLRRELENREIQILALSQLQRENEVLRQMAGVAKKHLPMDLHLAHIIDREEGMWTKSYMLDCGTNDGISAGDAVIINNALAGFISQAGTSWSSMSPVTHISASIGATVTKWGEVGVCEGDFLLAGNELLKLTYLDRDTRIRVGDKVETSGGGRFPKGFEIGVVREMYIDENGITAYGVVEPSADISRVDTVFVVKGYNE